MSFPMKKWWNSIIMFVYQRVCYLTVYWGHCKVTKVFQHVRRQAIPSAILAVHVPKPWTQFKYCISGQKHVSLSIVIYCHTWSSMNFACMLVKFYRSSHSMTEDPGPRYSVHFASIHGTHLCGSHFFPHLPLPLRHREGGSGVKSVFPTKRSFFHQETRCFFGSPSL